MSGYDPHHLGDASQRCGNPDHPEHVGQTCEQYEADELDIKPVPLDWKIENWLHADELFGNDQAKYEAFHARARAASDQALRAFREAHMWNGFYSGTRQRWPGLAGYSNTVRQKVRQKMSEHHATSSEDLEFIDPRIPISGSSAAVRPVPFDVDDPDHVHGVVFGLVAGEPRNVYVLRSGYTPDRWLAELTQSRHRPCAWKFEDCLSYSAGELLIVAAGQHLVAFGTCQACHQALTRNFSMAATR